MKRSVSILLAAGSVAALVGMAQAQPSGGGPRATLFDEPNFQGRSIVIVEGSPDLGGRGFDARPMSGRFEGDWTICDAPDLDGSCASVRGDIADLTEVGLRRVVSLGEAPRIQSDGDDRRASGFVTTDERAQVDQDAPADQQIQADDEPVPGARVASPDRALVASQPPPPPGKAASPGPTPQVAAPAAPPPAVAAPPPVTAAAAPSVTAAAAPPPPPAPAPPPSTLAGVTAAAAAPVTAAALPPPSAPKRHAGRLQLAAASPRSAASSAAATRPDGDAGHSAVFFAKPMKGGAEVAVDVQGPANQFCHDQGLGPAVYFDTDGHVLRDVLCRRP